MTTGSAVLITVREAAERLGWVHDASRDAEVLKATRRLLKLCEARGIAVEQYVDKGPRYVSGPQLDAYIATLQAER